MYSEGEQQERGTAKRAEGAAAGGPWSAGAKDKLHVAGDMGDVRGY